MRFFERETRWHRFRSVFVLAIFVRDVGEVRARHLMCEDVKDGVDGTEKVELDDCAPRGAFFLPGLARIRELEVCTTR